MVSNENNEEMSVNDILSSIKEVISSEQDLKNRLMMITLLSLPMLLMKKQFF